MKPVDKILALLFLAIIIGVLAGCATTGHEDTVTGAVAGGLIGGAVNGSKGAVTGSLLGAGIGVLSDAKDRKDATREQKINQMINAQTQGVGVSGGNAQIAGAVAETEKNVAFAKGERDKCQTKFAIYKQAGIKKPYNCEEVFNDALRRAEDASAVADPLLYNGAVYDGIRPGSRHARYWQTYRADPYYGYRRY